MRPLRQVLRPVAAHQARSFLRTCPVLLKDFSHYRKQKPQDATDPLAKPTQVEKGALHVVSVPIGNLKDFSLRALDVLNDVDYIVTSDRVATRTLLDLVNIPSQGRLIHYSKNNWSAGKEKLIELLKGGRSMALVTTSGTPCVGDVGSDLVLAMQQAGARVTSVPGPSALMSALSLSGVTRSHFEALDDNPVERHSFADGSFFFGNVMPESHMARLRLLRSVVATASHPCVFYEVPRRLPLILQDIAATMPKRRVIVAHELTKLNESLHADTAENLVHYYLRQEAQALVSKGQIVLVIAGATAEELAEHYTREVEKRQRLRRPIQDVVAGGGRKKVGRRVKSRRALRLKRKRERLIERIEKEQEKLRLNMQKNRFDAERGV